MKYIFRTLRDYIDSNILVDTICVNYCSTHITFDLVGEVIAKIVRSLLLMMT